MWVESHFGVLMDNVSNRLKRAIPCRLHGKDGAANALAELTGLAPEFCATTIKQVLLAGYHHRDPVSDFPLFAFRLHQFFSRGDTAYATLETIDERYVTVHRQQFKPSDRSHILIPLVFCRECGQEFYSVHIVTDKRTNEQSIAARDIDNDLDEDGVCKPGYLWLPENTEDVDSSVHYKFVTTSGEFSASGLRFGFLESPFSGCPHCGVEYNNKQRSDFAKLGTLGSEGRSTATTILSLAVIRSLRQRKELEEKARKLLSFTDNRQDASLQAGHLNDFLEVGWLRSALYAAVLKAGDEGIEHEELTNQVFQALNLPLEMYCKNPHQADFLIKQTNRALKQVLGYRLYLDLKRGWRVTSPNLEQCGLLEIHYHALDDTCLDSDRWQGKHEILVTASPEIRKHLCHVLLDYLRRELAIRVDYLDTDYHEKLQQLSSQYLIEPWSIDEDQQRLTFAGKAYPRGKQEDKRSNVYLSPRGGFGQYIRRKDILGLDKQPDTAATAQMIKDLLAVLCEAGIIEQVDMAHDGTPGYQLNAATMVWKAGDGTKPFRDPIRVPKPSKTGSANTFFVEFYRTVARGLLGLQAREHTAQVPYADRVEREDEFREGALPILYCSPTMELGIDISQLNVVNMRNVPPTPANYAQRSGRAGRSGQPALVFTYCSAGSPHDQYFFKRPHLMVTGEVTPPRIDLANEDLIRSHVHSIWLAETGQDLRSSLKEILDLSTDHPTLALKPEVKMALDCPKARSRALDRAESILLTLEADLMNAEWYKHGWAEKDVLNQVMLSFEAACERWRGLYLSALTQREIQHRVISDVSRSQRDRDKAKSLRREAESQIELLSGSEVIMQSDFYSYRYFASEGFLPGYNFPRLPLSAYIPGRRLGTGRDEFLSRPRFLAISEFGPRSIIYHEGSRYMIDKVIMPVSETDPTTGQAKICTQCGYFHEGQDKDVCESCGVSLEPALRDMFRLQNVSTRRRERINSDEEERLRMGFELKTGVRFKETDGKKNCRRAIASLDGVEVAKLTFGGTATIWRINLGLNRRKERHVHGFPLDLDKGRWVAENQLDGQTDPDDVEDPTSPRVKRVTPYVEDRRNCLIFEPTFTNDSPDDALKKMASLQSVLKQAIQVHYQLEDSELAAEPLPDRSNRRMILFYEAAEGGAGVLRRLVDDPNALAEVAREALNICHFDPDTGADLRRAPRSKEDCEAACYDCLMNYANQPDHTRLDRQYIKHFLMDLKSSVVQTSPTESSRSDYLSHLKQQCGSELEKAWLDFLETHNLRLPSTAQQGIPLCSTRPDFMYAEQKTVIYIDGPVHEYPDRHARDRQQEECLEDLGYRVIRFDYKDKWLAILTRYPHIFGGQR